MDKPATTYWTFENIIKTITALLAVMGFVYGVIQFFIQHERQYRQKIYEAQLELYNQVIDLSAKIATTPYDSIGRPSSDADSRKFDEYYYGKMTFFEDSLVEKAMIEFKGVKDDYMSQRPSIKMRDIQQSCLNLGYACRNSLQNTWGLKLQELKRNK